MKVWITKYALTRGIIEAEIIEQWNVRNDPVCVMVKYLCQFKNSDKYVLDSDDFCFDYECAIQKAEEMRQKKIASLKKQIEKLERMRFE